MILATILAAYFLSLGWITPSLGEFAAVPAPRDTQNPSAQKSEPQPPAPGQPQNSTGQAKPPAKPHRRKKAAVPDCSNSPSALNPAPATAGGNTNPGASTSSASTDSGPPSSKPCPPPKKVIRNGGSDEPTVQLTGGATAQQASIERSTTDQLNAASEENLKKLTGRQLTPTQQDMVTQIQEFMEQSKKAVAEGDLDRGHNLALKAHVLSDELVKP